MVQGSLPDKRIKMVLTMSKKWKVLCDWGVWWWHWSVLTLETFKTSRFLCRTKFETWKRRSWSQNWRRSTVTINNIQQSPDTDSHNGRQLRSSSCCCKTFELVSPVLKKETNPESEKVSSCTSGKNELKEKYSTKRPLQLALLLSAATSWTTEFAC